MDEQSKQAINYINHQQAAGRSTDDIRASLRASGWTEPAIDQLFANAGNTGTEPAPSAGPMPPAETAQPAPAEPQPKPAATQTTKPKRQRKPLLPKQFPKWALYVIGGIILIAAVVVALIFINQHAHQPTPQQAAANKLRQADVQNITAAIKDYAINHRNELPDRLTATDDGKTLVFCGDKCQPQDKTTAPLTYYEPPNISFHTYSDTLEAPNPQTVYIVRNASCSTDYQNIGSQTPKHWANVAILWAEAPYYGGSHKCSII